MENYVSENKKSQEYSEREDSDSDNDDGQFENKKLPLDYKQQLFNTIVERSSNEIGQNFINNLVVSCKYKP